MSSNLLVDTWSIQQLLIWRRQWRLFTISNVQKTLDFNYKLLGCSDSDWGGDTDDKKAQFDLCSTLNTQSSHGCWRISNRLSLFCEAEYIVVTSCVYHTIGLRNLLNELSLQQEEPTKIYVKNKSAIALTNNPIFHDRSKHIDTRYHYIRERVTWKEVQHEDTWSSSW